MRDIGDCHEHAIAALWQPFGPDRVVVIAGVRRVGVTSGASTPSQLTRRVIEYLEALEAPS